jgi:iron-sulfur cluster assembly accessory protein
MFTDRYGGVLMGTTQRPEATVNIGLTEKAQEQVRNFMEQENVSPETAGLRVSVMPGGCSGFKYGLNIEAKPLDDDLIVQRGDVRVFVDAFSAQYLNGTEIDYVSTMQASGFTFNNPNATGGCGCGESFSA